MSKRLYDSSWFYWSEPKNLSYPINTYKWEAYYTIDVSGEFAYFVSESFSEYGKEDIFRVLLPDSLRPNPTLGCIGRVIDKTTGKAIGGAMLEYERVSGTLHPKGEAQSDGTNGHFYISLIGGHRYHLYAQKEGYMAEAKWISVDSLLQNKSDSIVIEMVPIEKEARFELTELYFENESAIPMPDVLPELQRLHLWMQAHPDIQIRIEGHTSAVGDETYNLGLSQKRAEAVRHYLLQHGISENRVSAMVKVDQYIQRRVQKEKHGIDGLR